MLLALLILALAASCGDNPDDQDNVTDGGTTDSTAQVEAGYDYPEVDYGGYEFRVLNFDQYVNCNIRVDVEEQTGEKLDDAIWARNRKVEDKLGFRMKEIQSVFSNNWGSDQKELIGLVTSSVMAGDDLYDAAYLNLNFNIGAVTDGNFVDLRSIDTLDLDADWWDHVLNDSLTVNGKLYGASSPLMFATFDSSWCVFFNETMMEKNKLEYPYQLVRDGKWTIDRMNEYVSAAASLNGDESFTTWKVDGNSVYGIAGHSDGAPQGFVYSAGCDYVSEDGGEYKLTIGTERFYTAIDKLKKLFDLESGHARFHNGGKGNADGYIALFAKDRAMFMTAELKTAMEERDMESQFGILPMPKLDESQSEYRTFVGGGAALLCVPKTNKDVERTGVILDALSYESNESVLPVYYDVTVSQKGLRNEESIEMLQIIRATRGCEFGNFYSLVSGLISGVQGILCNGSNDEPASLVASNTDSVNENIQKLVEAFK